MYSVPSCTVWYYTVTNHLPTPQSPALLWIPVVKMLSRMETILTSVILYVSRDSTEVPTATRYSSTVTWYCSSCKYGSSQQSASTDHRWIASQFGVHIKLPIIHKSIAAPCELWFVICDLIATRSNTSSTSRIENVIGRPKWSLDNVVHHVHGSAFERFATTLEGNPTAIVQIKDLQITLQMHNDY